MSTVSIIVPVFNAEGTILECLDSLQAQTVTDIKIICIENGSTDNSWQKILSKKNDKRVLAMRTKEADVSQARNLGLFWAGKTSPLVMFCDADDTYDPHMVETMVNGITENGADLACCEIEVSYQSDHELRNSDDDYYTLKSEGLQTNMHELINTIDYSLCDKIFRSSIIQNYSIKFPSLLHYEDACFCWKYMSVSKSAYLIKKRLYHYIRHDNSIMNTTFAKSTKSIDHLYITADIYNFLVQNNLFDNYKDEFIELYINSLSFARYFADDTILERIDLLDTKLQKKFFKREGNEKFPSRY